MALGPRLDLRQTQSLVMTPQLQQAIKLLALSNLEIETFVAEALDSNPLLEIGETRREAGEPSREAPCEARVVPRSRRPLRSRDRPAGELGDDAHRGGRRRRAGARRRPFRPGRPLRRTVIGRRGAPDALLRRPVPPDASL